MGVLTVALRDNEATARKILEPTPDLPTLADPSGAIGTKYGVTVLPTNVYVDSKGRMVQVRVGTATPEEMQAIVNGFR